MEILPPHQQQQQQQDNRNGVKSSRHLYHNILNSAFEQHGDPYEDDDDDEFNMIATNVEILSSPVAVSSHSTSLPASPGHGNSSSNGKETVINIESPREEEQQQQKSSSNGNHYHLPLHPRPECHSARHVVGICQYHMQQHLKSHRQQHQLHRLYQQQQLLQQFANQQIQCVSPTPTSPTANNIVTPSIIQNPGSHEIHDDDARAVEQQQQPEQKKVQYIVVDTTTDRNKKPRPNKYCHVKAAQNCDKNRRCAASGPVDEV